MQKNRPIGPLDSLTAAFHTRQRGPIEEAYRKMKVDPHIIGTRYIHPGIKALKGLDAGNVIGETLPYGLNVPIVEGNAPVVALALWMHGLTEKELMRVPVCNAFMPYREQALELVKVYNSKFLPIAKSVEHECEYVPNRQDGNYRYYLNTDPIISEFGSLTSDESLRRMLFVMRAIDEWTKLGNLGRVRNFQKEGRSEEEIAVPVLHLYAPMVEAMRYHVLASEMYNDAFRKLDPQLFAFITNMVEKAGYVKGAAKAIEKDVRAIANEIANGNLGIAVVGREGGVKSPFSFFRKTIRKKAEETAEQDVLELRGEAARLRSEGRIESAEAKETQAEARKESLIDGYIKDYASAPFADKKAKMDKIRLMENAMDNAYDLIGFRMLLSGPDATPQKCREIGEFLKFRTAFSGKGADYITTPKKNGYSSYHLTSMFNGLLAEMQISTTEMDRRNNYSDGATSHAEHKKNISEDLRRIQEILTVEHFLGSPRFDSVDLKIELYEMHRKDQAKCIESIQTPSMRGIAVYDPGFIGYKIKKEMEMRGHPFAGLSSKRLDQLEKEIGDKKRIVVLARLLREPDSISFRLMDVPKVSSKK